MPNTLPSKPPASPKPPLPRAPAHLPAFADDMLPLSPGHTHVSVLWEGSSRSSSLPGQQQGSFDSAGGCLPRMCCELANKEHCQKALPAKKNPSPKHFIPLLHMLQRTEESSCNFKSWLLLFQIKKSQPMKKSKQRWHWAFQCIPRLMGWLVGGPPGGVS